MLSRTLPVRDIPANMQVTAKQIRYKGEDNLKNIFAVRRGSSDSGTGQEKMSVPAGLCRKQLIDRKEENLCVELLVIQVVKM